LAVLADFREYAYWEHTTVNAAARVSLLDDGGGELRIEVAPASSEFKFFAEPHAAIVVTDATGKIIAEKVVNELAMSMSGVHERHGIGRQQVDSGQFRNVAYAFFRLKFCAWHMGFDRTVKASNGCFKSSIRRELRQLAQALPERIGELSVEVGKPFEFVGWQGVRVR
jgi:hypothetical protein